VRLKEKDAYTDAANNRGSNHDSKLRFFSTRRKKRSGNNYGD
jgi:hypothetical protein